MGWVPTASWDRRAYDLNIYLSAAEAALNGGDPYAAIDAERGLGFTYPPLALMPFMALSRLPRDVAYAVTLVVTALVMAHLAYHLVRIVAPRASLGVIFAGSAALAFTDASFDSMNLGQVSGIVGALMVWGIIGDRPRSAAAAGVGAAIKLVPLSAAAALLARPQRWQRVAWLFGSALGLTAVGWLLSPHLSSRYWHHLVADTDRVGSVGSSSNTSLAGALAHLGMDHDHARTWGLALAAVLALVWTVAVLRRPPSGVMLAIGASSLAVLGLPVAWSHHAIGPSVAALCLVVTGRSLMGAGLGLVWLLPLFEWAGQVSGPLGVALQLMRPITLVLLVLATMTSRPSTVAGLRNLGGRRTA